MITKVEIQNCKSIVNASIILSPFTLLIGANGSGKTNFLQILREVSTLRSPGPFPIEKHINHQDSNQKIILTNSSGLSYTIQNNFVGPGKIAELSDIRVFSIDPSQVGQAEELTPNPTVQENGQGVVQVLDALKTGDREDLFEKIERSLTEYIPEIEKLSFIPGEKTKRLQVREKYLQAPLPVAQLSEGTKFVITILTIIFQKNPPTVICIEEIDRSLHPRLFEKIIQVCFDITQKESMPQIIATTHNPYLVDQFKDHEEAVILVEKEAGETRFTTLAERIEQVKPTAEDPLGELWFSGFIGGVPKKGVSN
jgi:predicted ATPase